LKVVNLPYVVIVYIVVVFREQAATHRGYKNASLFFLKVFSLARQREKVESMTVEAYCK